MADVENQNLETRAELSEPPKPDSQVEEVASPHPTQPLETKTSLAGVLGKLFKRNGRHPANCQCPLHRAPDSGSVFSPPDLSGVVSVESSFHPPAIAPNPARFEMWGRLAARAVKSAFKWLTSETPEKAKKVFGAEKGEELVEGLVIEAEELEDIHESATALAAKYNLTTGFDEEIQFCVTVGAVLGRVVLVNRKLDRALAELKKQTPETSG
jgi:hypothetical protein